MNAADVYNARCRELEFLRLEKHLPDSYEEKVREVRLERNRIEREELARYLLDQVDEIAQQREPVAA
jgi:hypothetical protein